MPQDLNDLFVWSTTSFCPPENCPWYILEGWDTLLQKTVGETFLKGSGKEPCRQPPPDCMCRAQERVPVGTEPLG